MIRIRLVASEAQRLARGALAAASPDDVTPVITGGLLSVRADGQVTLVATDRYRVHRIFTDAIPKADENANDDGVNIWDEGDVLLPRDALKWISANALKLKHWAHVVIEFDPYVPAVPASVSTGEPAYPGHLGSIRIEVRGGLGSELTLLPKEDGYLAYGCRPIAGNFPPVGRLFDGLEWSGESAAKGVLLNMDFVAGLKALGNRKGANARVRMSKPNEQGKPGPMGFAFEDGGKVYAEAIVQPNLDLR